LLICKLFELKALLQDLKFKITEQEIAEILWVSKALVMKYKQYKWQEWKQDILTINNYINKLVKFKNEYDDLKDYVINWIDWIEKKQWKRWYFKIVHEVTGLPETTFYMFKSWGSVLSYKRLLQIKNQIDNYNKLQEVLNTDWWKKIVEEYPKYKQYPDRLYLLYKVFYWKSDIFISYGYNLNKLHKELYSMLEKPSFIDYINNLWKEIINRKFRKK
jgi:hypothetical protein